MKLTINSIRDFCGLSKNILKGFLASKGKRGYLRELVDGQQYIRNFPFRQQIKIENFGNKNNDKVICVIRFPLNWIPTAGFFALFHRTLNALYFADKYCFTPVIDNWTDSFYEEKDPVNKTSSVWEYFFEPVSSVTMKDALYSKSVFMISNPNMDVCLSDYNVSWYTPSEEYLHALSKIYAKFVKFNDFTKNKLEKDLSELNLDFSKTLGIHFRGTDYKVNYDAHPIPLNIEDYYGHIDCLVESEKIDKIFVATDDKDAMVKIKEKYGKRILCYENTMRVTGLDGVHYAKNISDEKMQKYNRGYEVLKDAYTLSKCKHLISGYSMVSINTKIMKYATGETYDFMKVLSHGINKNGKKIKY